jgi:hypothetical protein
VTPDSYDYTDPDGDLLHVVGDGEWVRLDIERVTISAEARMSAVLIAAADVRKVTAAMHAKAGLPDRWAGLREHLDSLHRTACDEAQGTAVKGTPAADRIEGMGAALADVLRVMGELEAGR